MAVPSLWHESVSFLTGLTREGYLSARRLPIQLEQTLLSLTAKATPQTRHTRVFRIPVIDDV